MNENSASSRLAQRSSDDPTATRLYVVCGEQQDDDPLDVVAASAPFLNQRYGDVRWVTAGGDFSLRSLRRGLRPGRDRVLYDFTRPSVAFWAADVATRTPGAVLCGARRLPLQSVADPALRRARRRYGGLLRDAFGRGRLGALDVDIPAAVFRLSRPKFAISPTTAGTTTAAGQGRYACAMICAADGAAEAYGVIRGWLAARELSLDLNDASILLSVATAADEAQAHGYCQFLGVRADEINMDIECRKRRADLAVIAGRSDMLMDLDRFSWAGKTDALAAAEAAGIPHQRVTSFLSGIAGHVRNALLTPRASVPVSTAPEMLDFARALVQFIEAAQDAPLTNDLRLSAAR